MTAWLLWLLISGSLIIAEVFTLTFYLLLAGIGALVASGMAASGFSGPVQILTMTAVTLIGCVFVHKLRPQNQHPDHRTNPNLNMDIGTTVHIASVHPDGKFSVMLRGARWDAIVENDAAPSADTAYTITKIDGSTLILTPKS